MKFPTQFSSSSLYFFSLGSKHSSQQLVLTISVLRLEWENKIHVYIKKNYSFKQVSRDHQTHLDCREIKQSYYEQNRSLLLS